MLIGVAVMMKLITAYAVAPAASPSPTPTIAPSPTPLPVAELSGYQWPLPRGRLTLDFGPSAWGSRIVDGEAFHDGIDLATFCGDKIVAAHAGTVLAAGRRFDHLLGWVGDLQPYIDRLEKKQLIPEDKGRLVTAFLESFFERYVEYDFTADLEEKLDKISNGDISWKEVLREFWRQFSADVGNLLQATTRAPEHQNTKSFEGRLAPRLRVPRR